MSTTFLACHGMLTYSHTTLIPSTTSTLPTEPPCHPTPPPLPLLPVDSTHTALTMMDTAQVLCTPAVLSVSRTSEPKLTVNVCHMSIVIA